MESEGGLQSATHGSLGGGNDCCDAPEQKADDGGSGGGKVVGMKEGAFFLGEPTFLDLGGGRLRCAETGHEVLVKDKHAYGRTGVCRLALIDAAVAQRKPPVDTFRPHPISKRQLVCELTGDAVNKTEEHIWKHINGRRFLKKLAQKETEMLVSASCRRDKGDTEEPDFWMPPIERHSNSDGKDRPDSHTLLISEADEVSGLDGSDTVDDPETRELCMRAKRMSIAVGPSSFASRKKRSRKPLTLPKQI